MEIDLQPNLKLRSAIPADAGALVNLVAQYYAYDQIAYNAPEVQSGLATLLGNPSLGQAWLLIDGTQPVGYVIFTYGFDAEFGGRLATITDLFLAPSHRRKGVGTAILHQVENFCRGAGMRGLELQVERDNDEARGLYKKLGFKPADRIPMSKRIN